MKNVIITMAVGLYVVLLSAGVVFASGAERHDERRHAQTDQYESKIYGTIQSLPAGMIGIWNVNGREISVTKTTRIKEKYGKAEVGAYVEVEGTASGNTLNAYKVEVKRDRTERQ